MSTKSRAVRLGIWLVGCLIIVAACTDKTAPQTVSVANAPREKTTDDLLKEAEGGSVDAQLALGAKYSTGNGVTKNLVESCRWYEKAADAGSGAAGLQAAHCYSYEGPFGFDETKTYVYWKLAADEGIAEAQYEYATQHMFASVREVDAISRDEGDLQQFLTWGAKAAEQGYAPAIQSLGMAYLLGVREFLQKDKPLVLAREIDKGLELLHRGAKLDQWQSQWALAVLYQSGYSSVARDVELSDKYWDALAAQSSPDKQREIGLHYRVAYPRGYVNGKNKYRGKELNLAESNQVANEWFGKAARGGDREAYRWLGTAYAEGLGVYRDTQKANEYFLSAAKLGDPDAMQSLAFNYLRGEGVVRDYGEAYNWLLKASNDPTSLSRMERAKNALGVLLENGWGVEKDLVKSYAWYNLAAAQKYDKAKENTSRVEKQLSTEQILAAQKLSREWVPGIENALSSKSPAMSNSSLPETAVNNRSISVQATGSGFFVTSDGYVLTNNHVVDGCAEIRLPAENEKALVVVTDKSNDLALLKVAGSGKTPLAFSKDSDLKQGQEVFVFGYPLDGFLPAQGNFTVGLVSALAGPGNNSSLIQITAPVQPGNSGGPVLDKNGLVIGIVVAKVDAIKVAQVTGDIPQNVNFAIASNVVRRFATGNRVLIRESGGFQFFKKETSEIADVARRSTVKVECWR